MARTSRLHFSVFAFGAILGAGVAGTGSAQERGEEGPKTTECIVVGRIDKDFVINERTILFYIKGGEIYRNELPGFCTLLRYGETRLAYLYRTQTARLTRLCDFDSITVDTIENRRNQSCELGPFYSMTAAEAEALVANPVDAVPPSAQAGAGQEAPAGGQAQFGIRIDAPDTGPQCQASVSTGYYQANTVAKVEGNIQIEGCAAASGKYTLAARIRNANGETQVLEFEETFQRDTEQPLSFKTEYPIGENVELVNVRARNLRCECAEQ